MPKDNVERAIKKASDKNTENYKELFEGYTPHGIAILVETATDNNNRTVANVRSYLRNQWQPRHLRLRGVYVVEVAILESAEGVDVEELELEFIDFGVEEVFEDEDGILLYAPFENFGAIQKELESRSIEILSSGFDHIHNQQTTSSRPSRRSTQTNRKDRRRR